MTSTQSWLRFTAAAALIVSTTIYLQGRAKEWLSPPHLQVTDFPRTVGDYQGGDALPFSRDTLDVLGPGEFLERRYQRPPQPGIDLFLAYFPSQRTGDTIHSPKHCLPGAGWEPVESSLLQLKEPDGKPITVNYWVIAKGEQRQVALYWYQAHGRVVADEYRAKFYQVWDAMRLNRTDGSLVRVITPVVGFESLDSAKRRVMEFSEQLLPMLGAYIPG